MSKPITLLPRIGLGVVQPHLRFVGCLVPGEATRLFPTSGPSQWLFQGPPAESKL